MIYLAPLQGFTDFVYRNAYAEVFDGIDLMYIPYITTQKAQLLRKYEKEILPENNSNGKSVPQILVKDETEILELCSLLRDYGYREINLNLGCPYPMVTNRGKGSKLLEEPERLERILAFFFENFQIELSVKMRAGFETANDIEQIIPVLNRFPVKRVIVHPRIAKQLYSGTINTSAFQYAADHLFQAPVYNGDIVSPADYQKRSAMFPMVSDWMLGRGVLMDVFLPGKIHGRVYSEMQKREMLLRFHSKVLVPYMRLADNSGNALNKMKQFWIYFSHHFERKQKVFKIIKKLKATNFLEAGVEKLIRGEELKRPD